MHHLPSSGHLPVHKLASVFSATVATYKFYWFLSIIELNEEGHTNILKRDLFARMLANAWYTVNYFKLSFGKYDLIQDAVREILHIENLTVDVQKPLLYERLRTTQNKRTIAILNHFDKNVPHWFQSPWFPKMERKQIYEASMVNESRALYQLHPKFISIHHDWKDYLLKNAGILKAFCYWELCLFLQVRNPNVPDIANKLIKPAFRNGLTRQRKEYWKLVFDELGTIDCIFTNEKLTVSAYALDHFIPHAFVSHDLMWNLVPIDPSFNSRKSDLLPSLEVHFEGFYNIQKTAFEIVRHNAPKNKWLEDYLTLFPDGGFGYDRFRENVQPLLVIAGNNGFGRLVI